jgi:hypothetical protein
MQTQPLIYRCRAKLGVLPRLRVMLETMVDRDKAEAKLMVVQTNVMATGTVCAVAAFVVSRIVCGWTLINSDEE